MPRVLPDPTGPVTRGTPTRVESSSLSHRRTRGTKWRGGMGIVPLRCSGTHGWSADRSFDTISGTWRGSVVATGATRPVSFFTSPPSWHGCRRLSVDLPVDRHRPSSPEGQRWRHTNGIGTSYLLRIRDCHSP